MSTKTVLFDLDGTLLPMDQDVFVKGYFSMLAQKLLPYGYETEKLIRSIWLSVEAMVRNQEAITNEKAFWKAFASIYGEECKKDIHLFEEFYANEFKDARKFCGFAKEASEIVTYLKEQGIQVVLATNPIFPLTATEQRIEWAGLKKEDFRMFTTYENCYHCKPNPAYYQDILNTLDLDAADCLMVGNDVEEDMIAETLGMKVFLLTDCMINKKNKDISKWPNGGFSELLTYLKANIFETNV